MIVLAAVVIFAVVRAGPPRRVARSARSDDDPLRPVAAADHRRLAADLAAQGRHAEALREWLRATVQTIEERGILTPTPGRTGAATAREAGPLLPAAADQMRAATRAFDEVWFGGRTATTADVESGRAAAQAVACRRAWRIRPAPRPSGGTRSHGERYRSCGPKPPSNRPGGDGDSGSQSRCCSCWARWR